MEKMFSQTPCPPEGAKPGKQMLELRAIAQQADQDLTEEQKKQAAAFLMGMMAGVQARQSAP